jgi:putative radical SAM enzyme (TIGR03279 family)
MLHNKNARNVLKYSRMLKDSGINMNMQIVLCKGVNDGEELDRTIRELSQFVPELVSVSVVPVGLSAHRDGLYPIEPFLADDCRKVIRQIESWQEKFLKEFGSRLVYASDEFYLLAGEPLPAAIDYEDFPQIENGVGMLASFEDELTDALSKEWTPGEKVKTVIATGELVYPFIKEQVEKISRKYDIDTRVIAIKNNFFGGKVSVSGLICGQDLIEQLAGEDFDRLLFTRSMLKADEDIFLDDITLSELEEKLGVKACPVLNDGFEFLCAVLNARNEESI